MAIENGPQVLLPGGRHFGVPSDETDVERAAAMALVGQFVRDREFAANLTYYVTQHNLAALEALMQRNGHTRIHPHLMAYLTNAQNGQYLSADVDDVNHAQHPLPQYDPAAGPTVALY